jgi:predicted nuclease of predicted toxin-antitoxin system
MRFLADANIAPGVVAWLREQRHDVWHGTEHGLQGLPDHELFRRAAAEDRIVITFDLDFGEILALSAGTVSTITLRLRLRRTPHVIARLEHVLATCDQLLAGERVIVIVEDARHRARPLPIERT